MGAYFILYPQLKILTLIPILFIPLFVEIPAFFFGVLVPAPGLKCRRPGRGHCLVGPYRRIYIGDSAAAVVIKIPLTGVSEKIRQSTARKKTNRLQVIRPEAQGTKATFTGP